MAVANLQYTWTLFALPLKDALAAKLSAVQLAFTLFILAQTWLAPFEGWLADHFRPRPLALIGAALVGANWVGAGWARSLDSLYAFCLLGGLGCGLVMAAGGRIALRCFADRRGLAMGVVSMAYGLGPVIAVAPVQRAIESWGYARAFVVCGLVQAAVAALAATFLQEPQGAPSPSATPLARLPRVIATRTFALMYAVMALVAVGGLLITAQLAPMAASFGMSKETLVLGLGAVSLAIMLDRVTNAAARPFWGAVSDRLGRCETLALAFACEAAAIVLLAASGGHPLRFVVLSGVAFFAWGEIFSLFPAIVADVFGADEAMTDYGALFTAKGVASLLAGWGAARLVEGRVSWPSVLLAAAACDALAALLAFFPLRQAVTQESRSWAVRS